MPYDAQVTSKGAPSSDSRGFSVSLANSRPDAQAVQAVINGIDALSPQNGVVFAPFSLECAVGTFTNIWNSQRGDVPITFFQYSGGGGSTAPGNFLPLGDVAIIGTSLDPGSFPTAPGSQVLFAPASDPTVLANPTGFSWILDDKGSGNSRNLSYFTIDPPPGYVAVGIAFSNGPAPDPNNYWCVRSDLVRAVGANAVWSDSGQHWTSHNGDLNAAVASLPVPEPSMLYAPPTFLSAEGGNLPYALVMEQADLDVTPFAPTLPVYDPTITSGDVTTYGLTSVKILPFTAVPDPGYLNQSATSPFYFIAAETYWLCTSVLPTPQGGSFQVTETVGTSQTDSNGFTTETSLTVSADVGVAYGAASANVSASYTQAFGTSVDHTTNHSTEVQTQITLNLPAQPRTWIWERQTQITVFRMDTTQLSPVIYSEPDMMFIPT